MPIHIERIQENIFVFKMVGNIPTHEIVAAIADNLVAEIKTKPIELHAIYDVTEFDWDFEQFMTYIKGTKSESSDSPNEPLAGIIHEHFVGSNKWVLNLRTWWQKHMQKETTAFTSIELAVQYINDRTQPTKPTVDARYANAKDKFE